MYSIHHQVPPIPKKTSSRSFEKEFVEKRMDTLQKFLVAICDHEELRCSIYLSAFLKFSEKDHFEMMKSQYDKEVSSTSTLRDNFTKKAFEGPKPIKLSDFKSKEGTVRSRITKDLRDYAVSCEELQKNSIGAYERMIEICEELTKDFEKVSDTISRMTDQMAYLSSVHKRFNDHFKEGKWDLMQKMYQTMNTSYSKWGWLE